MLKSTMISFLGKVFYVTLCNLYKDIVWECVLSFYISVTGKWSMLSRGILDWRICWLRWQNIDYGICREKSELILLTGCGMSYWSLIRVTPFKLSAWVPFLNPATWVPDVIYCNSNNYTDFIVSRSWHMIMKICTCNKLLLPYTAKAYPALSK